MGKCVHTTRSNMLTRSQAEASPTIYVESLHCHLFEFKILGMIDHIKAIPSAYTIKLIECSFHCGQMSLHKQVVRHALVHAVNIN